MSREFYVPCQPYAYPIRSRLSSNRLKSLIKWRSAKVSKKLQVADASSSATCPEPSFSTDNNPIMTELSEVAGTSSANEANSTENFENQENFFNSTNNHSENNLVSNSFDPGTSSFSTINSLLCSNSDDFREITTTFDEITNNATDTDLSNYTTDNVDDEENPTQVEENSTVVGVEIQNENVGLQILDVGPVVFLQYGSVHSSFNTGTTMTEESLTSESLGNTTDNSTENTLEIIEIVTTMDNSRFENDFARPYYDTSVKPRCGSGPSEGVVSVNGVVGGMDCMPLRPGPFHYLISEQAKSLVALQELQNEVGALLEFRDLVIETFPNLRHKMAVTAAASADTGASSAGNGTASVLISSSQGSHIPLPLSSQSPSSRRIGEWEPGKVRRRVAQSRENESSSSSLPRSRSNSHSGGNKHSATVQDSGFSTETSSKDSASTAIPRPQSPSSRPVLDEAEDELWNLLDVIHRKGVRLREEVESLQGRLESVAPEELDVPSDILDAVRKVTRHTDDDDHHHLVDTGLDSREDELLLEDESSRVALLQREKLQLLDKVAELEAETISSRARAQELQSELAALAALRNGLEDRLRAGLENGDTGILIPGAQRIQPIEPTAPLQSPRGSSSALNIRSKDSAFASVVAGGVSGKTHKNRFRTRTIEKSALVTASGASRSIEDVNTVGSVNERRARLGALDSVLISPTRVPQQVPRTDVDTRKIAAILRERSPLELQRHLITTTVHNQVLQKRLDEAEKSSETLTERLGKAHEENEDLRFQLAERNIELEGTRARVRVLERLQQRPATENDADDESEPHQNGLESSSESQPTEQLKPSPRRRPSRIPLLGTTKPTAPKPPNPGHRRNDSRDSLRPSNNPSISSNRPVKRDSSRESLNKNSLTKPASRSLPRNNSLGKQQSRPAESPGTPPWRPPAPARRSQSQAARPVAEDAGKSMQSSNPPSSWLSSDASLYPDSLNSNGNNAAEEDDEDETSSRTASTRVEFIIGSPTRKRLFRTPWTVPCYFDSIDTNDALHESFTSDDYQAKQGEALAECDSLECGDKLESDS